MARMLTQRLKANNTEVASFKAEKIEAAASAESTAKKPEMETGGFMSRGDERSHLRKN
jgi:hypothetical protein